MFNLFFKASSNLFSRLKESFFILLSTSHSFTNFSIPVIWFFKLFRFFEIPATCNFLLTARHSDFLEIFDEDTVGYYDDNIESLKENINKYLKDEKLRKKMTKKAYKIVHERHTYLHRFKKMFKIIRREI